MKTYFPVNLFCFFILILSLFLVGVGPLKAVEEVENPFHTLALPIQTFKIGEIPFSLEIAKTPEALRRGLMGRTKLAGKKGMLFLFSTSKRHCFWMKQTRIPLDLLFLNSKGEVVEIITGLEPFSLKHRCASLPVTRAVEIPAGAVEKFQLKSGMTLRLINKK